MPIASVTDLVLNFAAACRALVPALDLAQVRHHYGEQYDNWDRVSEPLFRTLVIEPCVFAAVGEGGSDALRVAEYGASGAIERWNAYIALDGVPLTRLLQLSSRDSPFDQCTIMEGNTEKLVPLAGVHFVFVFVAPDGTQQQMATVDLDAK